MLQLNPDETFHFEILRILSHARYFGSDIGEVLEAVGTIEPGNMESFYQVFSELAIRVNGQAEQIDTSKNPVSARDAWFRAANYFRCADFFIHGNAADPRIDELWEQQTRAFDKAIALLDIPGERIMLQANGFEVPVIYFRASEDISTPRPTIILGNGYDGSQEEMLHVCGFAALERGYNVITYEGPGQPSVRRYQNLGFITNWEEVITPIVDHLVSRPEVDASKIGLFGYSMGGWLAVRAATHEHRLAAVFAVDGIYSVYQAYFNALTPQLRSLWEKEDYPAVDKAIMGILDSRHGPTALRWGVEQGLWSFNVQTPSEFLHKVKEMTLDGISQLVQCPVWVGEASQDHTFQGEPERVKEALGDRATYVRLTEEDGASHHCHVGASVLLNSLVFDWFDTVTFKS